MIFQNIVIHNFYEPLGEWNLRQCWNITSGIYAKYHVKIMLFVYTTTHKRFIIFTCRYFKLSWNTIALSQSKCRNFSCSSIIILRQACSEKLHWFPDSSSTPIRKLVLLQFSEDRKPVVFKKLFILIIIYSLKKKWKLPLEILQQFNVHCETQEPWNVYMW